MNSSVENLYQRFDRLMDSVFSRDYGKVQVAGDNYPSQLENEIQRAVEYKRRGDYKTSIEVYLSIFERNRIMYPAIMYFMYKSVLLSGDLKFAYAVITYADLFIRKAYGKYARTPFGYVPWSQTTAREELEQVILQLKSTTVITSNDTSSDDIMNWYLPIIKHNVEIIERQLKPLIERYSGGAKFVEENTALNCVSDVLVMYQSFRNQGYFD